MAIDAEKALDLRTQLYESITKAVTRYYQFVQADTNTKITAGIDVPIIKIPLFKSSFSTSAHGEEGLKTADAFLRDVKNNYDGNRSYHDMLKCVCKLLSTNRIRKEVIGVNAQNIWFDAADKKATVLRDCSLSERDKTFYGKNPMKEWTCSPHSLRYMVLREMYDGPILYFLKTIHHDPIGNVEILNMIKRQYQKRRTQICNNAGRDVNTDLDTDSISIYMHSLFHKLKFRTDTEDGPYHWLGYYTRRFKYSRSQSRDIWEKVVVFFCFTYLTGQQINLKNNARECMPELFAIDEGKNKLSDWYINQNDGYKQYVGALAYGDSDKCDSMINNMINHYNISAKDKTILILFNDFLKTTDHRTRDYKLMKEFILTLKGVGNE